MCFVACKGNQQYESDETVDKNQKTEDSINCDTSEIPTHADSQDINSNSSQVDEYYNDPLVVSYTKISDTMVINEDCVLFLWLDSLEVVDLQEKYPDGYLEVLDDMIYYASDAAIALDSEGIKNFFCDKSIIQFNNNFVLERKKTDGNMIFFKKDKAPLISYAIDFNLDSCRKYFTTSLTDSIDL